MSSLKTQKAQHRKENTPILKKKFGERLITKLNIRKDLEQ